MQSAKQDTPQPQTKSHLSGAAGQLAGMAATIALHPIDVVKVRFQVNDGAAKAVPKYRSTVHALREIASTEGYRALYRGVTPGLWGAGLSWGIYFYVYESAKAHLRHDLGLQPGQQLPVWTTMVSSWAGGTVSVFFTNPLWLIKTRMQLQFQRSVAQAAASHADMSVAAASASLRYPSMISSFQYILRTEGFFGLYKGLVPALVLTSHGVVQFSAYEELKHIGARYDWTVQPLVLDAGGCLTCNGPQTSGHYFIMGFLSKIVASAVTYPPQVIKARLQQDVEITGTKTYHGVVDCCKRIIKHEGLRGFYKGLAPNLMRSALQSALTLGAYEEISKFLHAQTTPTSYKH